MTTEERKHLKKILVLVLENVHNLHEKAKRYNEPRYERLAALSEERAKEIFAALASNQ